MRYFGTSTPSFSPRLKVDPADGWFVGDSALEEDGFELQVPFFEKLCRVLSKENAER
ncbi:MAG TPA: hypothetical protein VH230_12310 [Stellaceae bacterium]|nr:hypothetical protein [Stellaceae bacterium]